MKRHTAFIAASLLTLACFSPLLAQEPKKITVPAGTMMLIRLDKAVSSNDKEGTKFSGVLQADRKSVV